MPVCAVKNENDRPIRVKISESAYANVTVDEATWLRDELNALLGVEAVYQPQMMMRWQAGARNIIPLDPEVDAVVKAAVAWAAVYGAGMSSDEYMRRAFRQRLDLRRAVRNYLASARV